MYSDLLTFIKGLPLQEGADPVLPKSFQSLLPIDALQSIFSGINDSVRIATAIITLILALLACFLGYRLARFFMSLTGFMAGAYIGYKIGTQALNLQRPLTIVCAVVAGLALSVLAYRIYTAGIFILCAFLGFIAAATLLPFSGDLQFFLSVLSGFIIGALAVKYLRPVIILSSAIAGGFTASEMIVKVCTLMSLYKFTYFTSGGLTLIICVLGIAVQFLTTSDKESKKKKKKKKKE